MNGRFQAQNLIVWNSALGRLLRWAGSSRWQPPRTCLCTRWKAAMVRHGQQVDAQAPLQLDARAKQRCSQLAAGRF